MATRTVFFLVSLIGISTATVCMQYSCDATLQTNTCAMWPSGQAIKVNSNGCQSNYYCSASALLPWAESKVDLSTTFACSAMSTTTSTINFTPITCSTKQAQKDFKTGATTAIACNTNKDCQLVDGTYADCVCALRTDGYGTCKPDISNVAIFGGYWNDCGSNGVISNENSAVYWTTYMSFWVYDQSTLSCKTIFSEVQAIQSAYSAYNGASELALGLIGLLLL